VAMRAGMAWTPVYVGGIIIEWRAHVEAGNIL
jgi:hypothetical protein